MMLLPWPKLKNHIRATEGYGSCTTLIRRSIGMRHYPFSGLIFINKHVIRRMGGRKSTYGYQRVGEAVKDGRQMADGSIK
mmetsp:Transcript_20590/g.37763  ORF Transcript_20590/g.37763 Transcript_20590/m.37763 type:complete len:80 (+) Transcript_20590:19-258(+)